METNVFEQGSVKLNYIKLSMPLVLSLALSVVYNMADTYFISWTQDTNLVAGVSLCAPVFTLLMAFGNIFGQGGSSMVSRLLGQDDGENTKRVSAFCFYISILAGAVLAVVMLAAQTPILRLLGADSETFLYAREYYVVLAAGAPALVANFVHTNLLRSEGMPAQSMFGSVGGIVLNIVLDPIFITVLGMGARGAAIASVIGYIFTVVFCLAVVCKKSRNISVDPRQCRIKREYAGQIFGVGTSAALTNIMQSVCLVILNQYLLHYGNSEIAAMGIAQKVSMIALLILNGFSFGGQPIISYFYGAGKRDMLKELLTFAFTFMAVLAAVLTVALELSAPLLIRGFLKDEAVVRSGTLMFRWQMITMVCVAVIFMSTIIFQATGKVAAALIMSVCRQGVVFIAVIAVAAHFFGYMGILASQAAADAITLAIALVLFHLTVYRPVLSGGNPVHLSQKKQKSLQ